MKQKQVQKKLSLNKQTISHLEDREMKRLWGGTMLDTCCVGCTTIMACGDPETETIP